MRKSFKEKIDEIEMKDGMKNGIEGVKHTTTFPILIDSSSAVLSLAGSLVYWQATKRE
uniref:Uncharacterized protein n=1 Tax=Utricularia reniformis TaxID=192314 RepID=A0A1Y0B0X2_9LAMI|nr:hypothetical protein AEK19_MT0770 [Utricularia reniformis]ART31013.1 hypothetical protein AEK19_MT0770 [Utricularia reniformis]